MELPIREQGTLLTGVRGCDVAAKKPDELDTAERGLIGFLRWCVLNPADPREVDVRGAFFQSKPPLSWKPSQPGHYPLHWFSHLMHCFEVVGYRHPDKITAGIANKIYFRLVDSLHLNQETREEIIAHLSEDRIASGKVVS